MSDIFGRIRIGKNIEMRSRLLLMKTVALKQVELPACFEYLPRIGYVVKRALFF